MHQQSKVLQSLKDQNFTQKHEEHGFLFSKKRTKFNVYVYYIDELLQWALEPLPPKKNILMVVLGASRVYIIYLPF